MIRLFLLYSGDVARRVAVAVAGGLVLLLGLVLIPLPGPGLLVVPLGLAILALEFAWARRWLETLRQRAAAWGSSAQRAGDTVASRLRFWR